MAEKIIKSEPPKGGDAVGRKHVNGGKPITENEFKKMQAAKEKKQSKKEGESE